MRVANSRSSGARWQPSAITSVLMSAVPSTNSSMLPRILASLLAGLALTQPLLAVGATTASALERSCGRPVVAPADQRSEGVLALPQLQDVAGRDIVIVRGNGGRELIKQGLLARGAKAIVTDGALRDGSEIAADDVDIAVGACAGGIWKTTNNGTTWRPVFDDQRVISDQQRSLDF